MSDRTLELRVAQLLLVVLNMNRNIIEIHRTLQEVSNAVEDQDAKNKIINLITESQDIMTKTMERIEEYLEMARKS